MSQAGGSTVDDQIALDVHSISDLQNKGVPPTDDAPKYKYTADEKGNYGM
jgi:alanyl-tRNA synthetase